MSKWDDFKKSFENFADKAAIKTRELTDTASIKIKIAGKEADRDTEYKNLGKLMYAKLTATTPSEELTSKISETMERLDGIMKELEELYATDEAKKAQKAEEKKATAEKKDEGTEEVELNTEVMEQFGEARKTADEEYEKAKKAAEDSK